MAASGSTARKVVLAVVAWLGTCAFGSAQELEPRAYSPSPIGTTFVLGGFGRSQGPILLDPSLDVDNVEGDLWIATVGVGHIFGVAGRQARVLGVVPVAWGDVQGVVSGSPERQALRGLADPRVKFTIGLHGALALTAEEFARMPRQVVVGASVTVVHPSASTSRRASSTSDTTDGPSSPNWDSHIKSVVGRSTVTPARGCSPPITPTIRVPQRGSRIRCGRCRRM